MMDSTTRMRVAHIERGTFDDLDAVMEVMEAAFGDHYGEAWTRSQCAGILPMTGVSLMLARDPEDGTPIGFSLFRSVAGQAELLLLAVLPSHRRRGIGNCLLKNFIESTRCDGVERVHLEVRDGNPAAAMYRAAGFAPVGRRRKYYHAPDGSQFDALTFARDL
jgi:[ribosomal protein S18]-alanine N-acetyltransferase